jgi:rod shape-determining protein MreC
MARVLLGITDRFSARGQVIGTAIALLCVSFLLTAYSSRHPEVAQVGSVVVGEAVAPFGSALEAAKDGTSAAWSRYVHLSGVSIENDQLKQRLARAEGDLASMSEIGRENARLRELLRFSSEAGVAGVAASVVGSDPSGWVRGALINRGTSSGVDIGMAVVTPQGVIGQVVAASPDTARVLLITDHSSGVDAIVQSSRVRGVLQGAGASGCELRFVTKDAAIKLGDLVVTSGLDRVYPKGLVLGTVAALSSSGPGLFQAVSVKPSADVQRAEEVLVVGVPKYLDPSIPGGASR